MVFLFVPLHIGPNRPNAACSQKIAKAAPVVGQLIARLNSRGQAEAVITGAAVARKAGDGAIVHQRLQVVNPHDLDEPSEAAVPVEVCSLTRPAFSSVWSQPRRSSSDVQMEKVRGGKNIGKTGSDQPAVLRWIRGHIAIPGICRHATGPRNDDTRQIHRHRFLCRRSAATDEAAEGWRVTR